MDYSLLIAFVAVISNLIAIYRMDYYKQLYKFSSIKGNVELSKIGLLLTQSHEAAHANDNDLAHSFNVAANLLACELANKRSKEDEQKTF